MTAKKRLSPNLRKDLSILIAKADKSNSVVVMDTKQKNSTLIKAYLRSLELFFEIPKISFQTRFFLLD